MGKAPGCAAAEHKADRRPAAFYGDLTGIDRFARNVGACHGNPRSFAGAGSARIVLQSIQDMVNLAAIWLGPYWSGASAPPSSGLKLPRLHLRKIQWAGGYSAAGGAVPLRSAMSPFLPYFYCPARRPLRSRT